MIPRRRIGSGFKLHPLFIAAASICAAPAASAAPLQLSFTETLVPLYWPVALGAALLLVSGCAAVLKIRLGRALDEGEKRFESLRADNKNVYRQLLSYGSELSARERELGEARETIEQQRQEKADLQTVIGHHLRRPLEAMRSPLKLLARRSHDKESAELAATAQRQLQASLQSLDEIRRLGELETMELKLPADSPDSASLSILLVEASVEGSLQKSLEARGHRVQRETNGLDGADAALQNRFDLVLLDSNLPLMDGVEAAGKIRRGSDAELPIFAMVPDLRSGDRERYRTRGLTGVLSRPVSDYQLQKLLKWTQRRPAPQRKQRPTRLLNNGTLVHQRETLGHLQFAELLSDRIATLPKKVTALTSALTGRHWLDSEEMARALAASADEIGLEAIAARLRALAARLSIDSEREYCRHQRTELLNLMRTSVQQLKAWRERNMYAEGALQ